MLLNKINHFYQKTNYLNLKQRLVLKKIIPAFIKYLKNSKVTNLKYKHTLLGKSNLEENKILQCFLVHVSFENKRSF